MDQERVEAGGLIYKENIAMVGLIGIPTHPGIGGRYFTKIADLGIHVELIVNLFDGKEFDHILICVKKEDFQETLDITQRIHEKIGSQRVIQEPDVALVCISSLDFDDSQKIAGHMFKTLGDSEINIHGISSSVSSLTCMIDGRDLEKALNALRKAFILP